MYSEQLAVLLILAATQMQANGLGAQPIAQVPRAGVERMSLQLKQDKSLINARNVSNRIKREREVVRLAGIE